MPSSPAVGDLRNPIADQAGVVANRAAQIFIVDAKGSDIVGGQAIVAAAIEWAGGDQPLSILQDRAAVTPLIAV